MALSVSCARSSRWLSCSVAEELWHRLEFWRSSRSCAVIFTLPSARLRPGSRTHQLIVGSSETTAQITVRLVVLLLLSLGGLAIASDLDVVLGVLAAGPHTAEHLRLAKRDLDSQ
jgi:hypothetical protein